MNSIIKLKHKKSRNISLMNSNRNKIAGDYSSKIALTQADDSPALLSLMKNEIKYQLPCYKRGGNKQLKPYPLLQTTSPPRKHEGDTSKMTTNIYQQYDRDVIKSLSCFDLTHKETESTVAHQELSPSLSKPIDKKIRISLIKGSRNANKKKELISMTNNFQSVKLAGLLVRTTRNSSNKAKEKLKPKSKQKISFEIEDNTSSITEEIDSPENLHLLLVALIQKNKKCLFQNESKDNPHSKDKEEEVEL